MTILKFMDKEDRLLSRKETAQLLGVKPSTLAVWASTGRYNLPFVKVGRLTKYSLKSILDFIEQSTNEAV